MYIYWILYIIDEGKGENKKMITNMIIAIVAVTTGIIGGYLLETLTD